MNALLDGSETSLLVTNISPSLDEAHIRELFGECGTIEECSVVHAGTPLARCSLTFATHNELKVALLLNNVALGGLPLKLVAVSSAGEAVVADSASTAAAIAAAGRAAISGDASSGATHAELVFAQRADEVARTVYVGNLATSVGASTLKDLFSETANVSYVKMAGVSADNVAYAFVEFATVDDAVRARKLDGSLVSGKSIKVGPAANPIVKTLPSATAKVTSSKEKDRGSAVQRIKEMQERLKNKYVDDGDNDGNRDSERHRSRDSSDRRRRSPSRESRSRETNRYRRRSRSRSRSRDRYRRRHRRRSRTPERRSYRDRRSRSPRVYKKRSHHSSRDQVADPHANMIWDGFQWVPKAAVDPGLLAAVSSNNHH